MLSQVGCDARSATRNGATRRKQALRKKYCCLWKKKKNNFLWVQFRQEPWFWGGFPCITKNRVKCPNHQSTNQGLPDMCWLLGCCHDPTSNMWFVCLWKKNSLCKFRTIPSCFSHKVKLKIPEDAKRQMSKLGVEGLGHVGVWFSVVVGSGRKS